MKAYLVTTGTLFMLLAIAHALRTIQEWPGSDPWFILVPGIGVMAAGLSLWALRLLRRAR